MTITREQLEKAAKAAGMLVDEQPTTSVWRDWKKLAILNNKGGHTTWNPTHDHGQLLDLAMACKIDILPRNDYISYIAGKRVNNVGVDCQNFPELAEAVILAACEQFDAKGGE